MNFDVVASAMWSSAQRSGRCSAVLVAAAAILGKQCRPRNPPLPHLNDASAEDTRPAIGAALSFSLDRVARANEAYFLTASPPQSRSPFDCADSCKPALPIAQYVQRFIRYAPCSREVLVSAVAYVDRFVECNSGRVRLTPFNVHRLFAAGFVVASKFASDSYFSNKFYSLVAGVGLSELNSLERILLTEIHFALNLDASTFSSYAGPTDDLASYAASVSADIGQGVDAAIREAALRDSPPSPGR